MEGQEKKNKSDDKEDSKEKKEDETERRKEKLKEWLKNPYNLVLLGVMFFAFILRFYYFWLTKNQPLWWDESEYTAYAKTLVGKANYSLGEQRLPGFPTFLSVFYLMGLSEPTIKFFAVFVPSLILIFLTYLLLTKMYDKKIGLISALILTVLWEHAFYSNRIHTENLALIFEFVAIFLILDLWQKGKAWSKKKNILQIFYILISCILSVFLRPGNLLFVPALLVFLALYWVFSLKISDKSKNIIITFSSIIIFLSVLFFLLKIIPKIPLLSTYYHPDQPLGWKSLTFFNGIYLNSFPASVFFITFLIGSVFSLSNFLLAFGYLKKFFLEKKETASDLLNILIISFVLFAMIFILRANSFEYRWFFPMLPGLLAFTTKGITKTTEFVNNLIKTKHLQIILVIVILIFGCYPQIVHTNELLKLKLDSYSQVRDAALWMKENTNKSDIIFSLSHPQTSYYSERKVISYSLTKNDSDLDSLIEKYKPKYLTVSIFEKHPEFAYTYPQRRNNTLIPVKGYTTQTPQGEQPVLIIYEVKHNLTQQYF